MNNDLQWGIFLLTTQSPGLTPEEVIRRATDYTLYAEKLGMNSAWTLEHHFTKYGLVGSALTQAAFLLGKTVTINVGTAINVIPTEHPVRLAEEVALLDQMSGGRIMFGIGRGHFIKDYMVFGVDMSKNTEMLMEGYELMMQAWATGSCSAQSEYYNFPKVDVNPPTYTKPNPPVYTVATSPETLEWAGSKGIPLLLTAFYDDEELLGMMQFYNEIADANGHDINAIPHVLTRIGGAATTFDIRAASVPLLNWWMDEFTGASSLYTTQGKNIRGYDWHRRRREQAIMRGEKKPSAGSQKVIDINPIGSPQECIDKLSRSMEILGVRHAAFGFEAVSDSVQIVKESMDCFNEEVLPKITLPEKVW